MSDSGNILILDDEPAVCTLVKRCLEPGGFQVDMVHSGADLRGLTAGGRRFDLIILDLNLKGEDGLVVLREINEKLGTPVIILTARGEPVDRVVGLELGADDYVPKPFEPRELLARVRSVLRRARQPIEAAPQKKSDVAHFEGWKLDLKARTLDDPGGDAVTLTTAQFDILASLVANPNKVMTRDEIMDEARNRAASPFDRSIDVHIGHLRKKIEADPKNPRIIKTVYGSGYMFATEVEYG